MSYEKYYSNGWADGETGATPITAEALNHMEDGIAGFGIQAVNVSLGSQTVNDSGAIAVTVDVSSSIPNGYTMIAALPRSTGSYAFYYYTCGIASPTSVYVQLMRTRDSVTTTSPQVTLICVKGF